MAKAPVDAARAAAARWPATCGVIAAACIFASCAAELGGGFHFAARVLDEDWEEDMVGGGGFLVVRPEGFPVDFQVGAVGSVATTIIEDYSIFEYYGAARLSWQLGSSNALYYAGAGVARVEGMREKNISVIRYTDVAAAALVYTGVIWRLQNVDIGVDFRYLFETRLDLGGTRDAGGFQGGFVLGWGLCDL